MFLTCDNCGRIETEPYDIGDACYQICGGIFRDKTEQQKSIPSEKDPMPKNDIDLNNDFRMEILSEIENAQKAVEAKILLG